MKFKGSTNLMTMRQGIHIRPLEGGWDKDHESGIHTRRAKLSDVLGDVLEEARKHGEEIEALDSNMVVVTQSDGQKTLVYKTMGRVHGAPDLTPDEIEDMAETVRELRANLKKTS